MHATHLIRILQACPQWIAKKHSKDSRRRPQETFHNIRRKNLMVKRKGKVNEVDKGTEASKQAE